MKTPIIEFNNFSFRYESLVEKTLKNINLKIYPNEKVLILGPSGSGKSTLSYCINGLIPHSFSGEIQGSCKVHDQPIESNTIYGLSHYVGTVLQDSDLQFVGLTVGEDIAYLMENKNTKREIMLDKVLESAKRVGMEKYLKHVPFSLSGGQKQKVSIGGVLYDSVDILLFDEPLASLDPQTGKDAIDLIDNLNKDTGATIVIIEHRLEDVLYRAIDRIILMEEGEIVADLTPNQLLATDLLPKYGIREPLYLSAIKAFGGTLNPADTLDNLDTLDLNPYKNEIATRLSHFNPKTIQAHVGRPLFEVSNVSFSYRDTDALSDVSFTIYEKERIALIGENGAGKTTLAKILTGALRPISGTVQFEGKNYLNYSIKELAQHIGYVMQNPNQMLVKDIVKEEVKLALKLRQISEEIIDARVESVLKVTDLYSLRNWPIDSLSYGQKKRVTIASMLVLDPKCLILDEPTAGQDYRHYKEVMAFVDNLNKDYGLAIIFITHDMHLAMEYTDRALVLSNGRLIADESTYAVLSNPDLLKQASLKETSLSQLANALDINGKHLIEAFVNYEKEGDTYG